MGNTRGKPTSGYPSEGKHDYKLENIFSLDPYAVESIRYVDLGQVHWPQARVRIQDLLQDPPQGASKLH
jgi:hypothetical protein